MRHRKANNGKLSSGNYLFEFRPGGRQLAVAASYLGELNIAHSLLGNSTEKGRMYRGRGWEDGDDRTNSSTAPQVSAGGQNRRPWCRGPALTPSHRQEWKYCIIIGFSIESIIFLWSKALLDREKDRIAPVNLFFISAKLIFSWSIFIKDWWELFDHGQPF